MITVVCDCKMKRMELYWCLRERVPAHPRKTRNCGITGRIEVSLHPVLVCRYLVHRLYDVEDDFHDDVVAASSSLNAAAFNSFRSRLSCSFSRRVLRSFSF